MENDNTFEVTCNRGMIFHGVENGKEYNFRVTWGINREHKVFAINSVERVDVLGNEKPEKYHLVVYNPENEK